jgi:queuine tRNA-ribosyltransferase
MIFPIDEMAITYVDTEYTKAYLRHLFAANEYLGNKLLPSIILVLYVVGREARKHILGDFRTWKEMMVRNMNQRL